MDEAIAPPPSLTGARRQRRPARRRLVVAGVVLAAIVVVLGVAQLVLPGLAAQRLRDQLARSGQVLSVTVSAFPAIELLWHHADRVVIRLGRYQSAPAQLRRHLAQLADAGTVDVFAQQLTDGVLTVHSARLLKRGSRLAATAQVSDADLRSVLPLLSSVTPVASSGGQLTLRGTSGLLGLSVDVTVSARNGALVAAPDIPFGGLATITLFADPGVTVQRIAATAVPGGFAVQALGTLS
ncbi:MAG TPA: hypothetical protein VFN87_13710 [Solirubrobacteraceae bacterium]|nr:hypothetical protein [Solirubrobacteraceae bacterium]